MKHKMAVYNVKWMKDLFFSDGRPKTVNESRSQDRRDGARNARLAKVVRAIDPDVLCIVEGPDTLSNQSKTASNQLLAWRDLHNLDPDYAAVHGIPSGEARSSASFTGKTWSIWFTTPSDSPPNTPTIRPTA